MLVYQFMQMVIHSSSNWAQHRAATLIITKLLPIVQHLKLSTICWLDTNEWLSQVVKGRELTTWCVLMACYARSADAILKDYGKNWPSVLVKMTSSWVCVFVYIFTLFVPRCLPGRDFSYVEGAAETAPRRGRHDGTLVWAHRLHCLACCCHTLQNYRFVKETRKYLIFYSLECMLNDSKPLSVCNA